MNKETYKAYLRQRLYEEKSKSAEKQDWLRHALEQESARRKEERDNPKEPEEPEGGTKEEREANLPIPGSPAETAKKEKDRLAKIEKMKEEAAAKKDDDDDKNDTADHDVYVQKGKKDPRFVPRGGHPTWETGNSSELDTDERGTRQSDTTYISDKKQKEIDASVDPEVVKRRETRKERKARQEDREEKKLKKARENNYYLPKHLFEPNKHLHNRGSPKSK